MSKIGILTHPFEKNYGGIVQNWALQHTLRKMGYDPVTVNWKCNIPSWREFLSFYTLRCVASYLYHLVKAPRMNFPKSPLWCDKNTLGFQEFIKKNIRTTGIVYKANVNRFVERNFDVLIVGSDQVWRPLYINPIEMMFFPFKKRAGQKKIAFSASFGTDQWEFTPQQTESCKQLIQDFDFVSVREKSGIELCRKHLGYLDAAWTLDPTLMVDREEYEILCAHVQRDKDGYLFEYILDDNEVKKSVCQKAHRQLGLNRKRLSVDTRVSRDNTIEDWLSSFRDARYVITDSFHGVVFCLILHKPFAFFYNPDRGSARFNSLIELFPPIADRIVAEEKLPDAPIDWAVIDLTVDKFRAKTLSFLKNALA